MSLIGEVIEVSLLTSAQRDRMFEILTAYFDGAERWVFDRDLDEKHWAVVLTEPETNQVQGFSTLCLIEDVVEGQSVRAFFSGDTIIDGAHRGSMVLEKAWLRFTFTHALQNPNFRYFWFLIVNSYRSFRYLPIYAKTYYPNPDYLMPHFERTVLDQLSTKRYGDEYDPTMGVIRMKNNWRLRPGVADIGEKERRDARIRFFEECNPEWKNGVELACLSEFTIDNINRVALRMIDDIRVPVSAQDSQSAALLP